MYGVASSFSRLEPCRLRPGELDSLSIIEEIDEDDD